MLASARCCLLVRGIATTSSRQSLSSKPFRLGRFTRDEIRARLDKQRLNDATNERIRATERLPDSVGVRPFSDLWRPFVFAIGTTGTAFVFLSVYNYETNKPGRSHTRGFLDRLIDKVQSVLPEPFSTSPISEGHRAFYKILILNAAVFLAWRIPSANAFMYRYFSNSFASRSLCLPMLLSVFSHQTVLHFGLNMYVLYSFLPMSVDNLLGRDSFYALFISAGVVSSLASLVHKAAIRSNIRALGASGAILGLLVYTCAKLPNMRLQIIFLPFFDFSSESAIYGILLIDFIGLLCGWRRFDHAAHLGGALFGLWYAKRGEQRLWTSTESLRGEIYRILHEEDAKKRAK